jgi:hypothetical protein
VPLTDIAALNHREFECPVKRERAWFADPALSRYLPLEFMGVGPAGPDYDERTRPRQDAIIAAWLNERRY